MKILSFPHLALTTPTKKWDFKETTRDELILIGIELLKTLEETPHGVALAANQVGLAHRLFVVKEDFADENGLPTLIVNPEIVGLLSGNNEQQEGCLSFPGMLINVRRLNQVLFGYQDVDGNVKSATLSNFPARMVQHECEHLDGKTFMGNMNRIDRFRIMAEMKKRKVAGLA